MTEKKAFPYLLVATISLGWMFINVPMFILGPILPAIEEHYQIPHTQAGVLVSSYMIGYAIMQLLAGSLGIKYGEENFLILGILGTSIMTITNWALNDFPQMIILRFVTGLFGGMYYAPSNSLITRSAASGDRGKALGLVFISGPASRMLVFVLSGVLILHNVDWQNLFLYYGFPGLIFTPVMILLLKRQHFPRFDIKKETLSTNTRDLSVFQTLKQRTVIQILTINFVIALASNPLRTFFPVFFVTERGLTIPDTSFLMNVVNIAGLVCMPLAGYVTDQFGFKTPSYLSLIITSCISVVVPSSPVGLYTVIFFILWGVFGCMSFTPLMVLITDVVPDRARGVFFGILNFVGWIGGTIGPIVLGKIIDSFGFQTFFFSILIILFVSICIVATVKKK